MCTCQPIKWQYGPRTQGDCLDHNRTADLERVLRKAFGLPVEPWLSSDSCNLPWLVFETASDEPIVPFVMAKGGNLPSIVSLMHRSPSILALTLHVRWSLPASPAAPASASREGGKLRGPRSRVHEARSGGIPGAQLRCADSSRVPSSPQHQANSSAPPSIYLSVLCQSVQSVTQSGSVSVSVLVRSVCQSLPVSPVASLAPPPPPVLPSPLSPPALPSPLSLCCLWANCPSLVFVAFLSSFVALPPPPLVVLLGLVAL